MALEGVMVIVWGLEMCIGRASLHGDWEFVWG